jgi:fibronectin-binding autotransporter adhesin
MSGGTVNVDRLSFGLNADETMEAVGTMTGGQLNISGRGTYIGGNGGGMSGQSYSGGRMNVSGGTVTNATATEVGSVKGLGNLTISGGAWNQVGTVDARYTQIGKADIRTDKSTPLGELVISGSGAFNSNQRVAVGQNAIVGTARQSAEGRLTMDGGTLTITNNTALEVNYGLVQINGGVISVDNLDVGVRTTDLGGGDVVSTTGRVNFAGGTLNSKGTTFNNGSALTVGNGVTAARLNLTSGNHTFADGLTISAGATLGGAGLIIADVTISGALAPGNSIGTLSVEGDVTWNAGDAWTFELGTAGAALETPGTADLLAIFEGGDFLKGSGSGFTFDFGNTGELGWYKLAQWAGTTDFQSSDFSAVNLAGGTSAEFEISDDVLYMQVIPEPTTALIYLLGALGLGWHRIRRRTHPV